MQTKPDPTYLRFSASLVSRRPDDKFRDFTVTYCIDDKEFSVFEKVVPNSGFKGGKFMQKTLCINPKTQKPYEPSEVYLGAILNLDGWEFVLQEASEDTIKTMEAHPDTFKKCDLVGVMEKLKGLDPKELLAEFQKEDTRKRGRVTFDAVQSILKRKNVVLDDQEFLTLYRRFQFLDTDRFEYQDFINLLL